MGLRGVCIWGRLATLTVMGRSDNFWRHRAESRSLEIQKGARSSAGRALHWQCRGRRFDPDRVHFFSCLAGNCFNDKLCCCQRSKIFVNQRQQFSAPESSSDSSRNILVTSFMICSSLSSSALRAVFSQRFASERRATLISPNPPNT